MAIGYFLKTGLGKYLINYQAQGRETLYKYLIFGTSSCGTDIISGRDFFLRL